jgi:hypothetical protein
MGYTDVSDSKDRKYFHSVYVRTPEGALFEAAYSVPESFTTDEILTILVPNFSCRPGSKTSAKSCCLNWKKLNTNAADL